MLNKKEDFIDNMADKIAKIKSNIEIYFKDDERDNMVFEFAKRLSALIEYKKCKGKTSLTKISKELNIGKSTLSEYSSGVKFPKLEILLKLANYFNVSLDYLLGRCENEKSKNNELNKRFGLNDNAIDILEMVFPNEYLNVLFDNDRDTINYLLEEIKNYGDDLNSFNKLDKTDKNYEIIRISKMQAIKHTKYRLQDALIDLVDNYYKK